MLRLIHDAPTLSLTSMDSSNLKAASAYINNLLLARGLLRNGKSVEFARPSKGEGGTEATMAQIINLVHDMILRRDVIAF
jgi:Afadin- and alpha -actinin-Binding